jgi:hypothetical protein
MASDHPAIDREKVLAVLTKRFPLAAPPDVAAAANAIVGLEPDYELLSATDVRRFELECQARQYTAHHLATGDIRVYCRSRRR